MIIVGKKAGKKAKNEARSGNTLLKSCCSLSYSNINYSQLTVNSKNELFAKALVIKSHTNTQYKYVKEQYHVGAVTSGGWTTGGVFKTGGYINAKDSHTKKCQLVFRTLGDDGKKIIEKQIDTIKIEGPLKEQVKGSAIEKYTKETPWGLYLYVLDEKKSGDDDLSLALFRSGLKLESFNLSHELETERCPTNYKCGEIIYWLSTVDNCN